MILWPVLALTVALTVAFPTVVAAAPNAQLVASVQHRLDFLGFREVDARTLTTRQIAALHMQLLGHTLGNGRPRIETRGKVKAILRWD